METIAVKHWIYYTIIVDNIYNYNFIKWEEDAMQKPCPKIIKYTSPDKNLEEFSTWKRY